MLRDLSALTTGGRGILGTNLVGVLASDMPTGFALPGLLNNDVAAGDPAGTLYRVEILTQPSAGTLSVDETGAFSFLGAPDGTYTGTERVYKNGAAVYDTTYSLAVGVVAAQLSGSAAARASSSGTLSSVIALAGAALVAASMSGPLSTGTNGLSGAASAAAGASGVLTTSIRMVGTVLSQAAVSGSIATAAVGLSGGVSATAGASGALTTSIPLSGAALAQVVMSAQLFGQGAALTGYAQARVACAGALSTVTTLSGAVLVQAVVSGTLALPTMCADQNIWRGYVPKAKTYTIGGASVAIPSAFTLRGGRPTADMDPDDIEHYGVSIADILATLPNVTVLGIDPVTAGVSVPAGEVVALDPNGDATVLLSGLGLSDVDDNFCTFRIKLSNKEQRDRTIYFRRKDK